MFVQRKLSEALLRMKHRVRSVLTGRGADAAWYTLQTGVGHSSSRGWVSPTRARWSRICSQVLFSLPNRCCGANRNEHQGQEQCSGSGLCEAARVCWPCALVTMIMAVEGMGTRREGVLLVTAGREDALFLSRARSAPGYIYPRCLGFVTVYLVP